MREFPPGKDMGRDDIVGRKLVGIRQVFKMNDNGLDWAHTFYALDSGASFCLTLQGGGGFCVETTPADAKPLDGPQLGLVLGQRIAHVLEDGAEVCSGFDYPYLVLENGYAVTDVLADYHGTGFA